MKRFRLSFISHHQSHTTNHALLLSDFSISKVFCEAGSNINNYFDIYNSIVRSYGDISENGSHGVHENSWVGVDNACG